MRSATEETEHKGSARAVADGPEVVSLGRLRRYKVAAGDADVRGWQVFTADGDKIGQVDDLLVDIAAKKIRYLQVRLARRLVAEATATHPEKDAEAEAPGAATPGGILTGGSLAEYLVRETLSDLENRLTADHHLRDYHYAGERHILVPIGRARLDTESDHVIVDGLRAGDVLRLPPYNPGSLDRAFEETLRQAFDGAWPPESKGDFYTHELYDERRFYQARRKRTR